MQRLKVYIYQKDNWPNFTWRAEDIVNLLSEARNLQGRLTGKMELLGFDGKLTSSKWAKIAKCSKDTAIRDINDLINKNILRKEAAGGRSTHYELVK